ncbi:MAG: dual specificity protein phosphatase family protein [Candidatus Paceibacterota bacterium]
MVTHVNKNLYRGSRPLSFADLQPFGIEHVVNLQSGAYEAATETQYESEAAKDFGMVETCVPCSDLFPPSRDAVHRILGIIAGGNRVYVHCLHGQDRTGFVCAAYRMRVCGWSLSDAMREMFQFGFHKVPYLWWAWFLREYAEGTVQR